MHILSLLFSVLKEKNISTKYIEIFPLNSLFTYVKGHSCGLAAY